MAKIDIRKFSQEELIEHLVGMGEKKFRARQIDEWLWKKSARSFDEMTNLSLDLRARLKESFTIETLTVSEVQQSDDGTLKIAFSTHDGKVIEGVLIPTEKRMTACISSQVGCSLTCKFCATGRLKRMRNLQAHEVVDQVVEINRLAEQYYQKSLTNIVMMGMGEPLLNYAEVNRGIDRITSEDGLGMAARRITLSTAGIAKMIRKLGEDKVRFNLALSLHAANDEKRDFIMPINEQNNLDVLADALNFYYRETGNPVTFEYIIFKGFNDEISDARELAQFCRKVPSKVNIIEYNPIDDGEFEQADPDKVDAFVAYLERNGVTAKVRRSRGKDIDAACGQLANKNKAGFNLSS
ncbi:23S rRNA (adenine(2503)-C(2))-methyltransferase RlmN [bacterium SCSIO 12741]|nr:23S rRNA (adenine(2503)-C(2))-methyltransferase RlmN [bacterium SCSIO 12741]